MNGKLYLVLRQKLWGFFDAGTGCRSISLNLLWNFWFWAFHFCRGAGVWRYGSIFSYLNFFKLLLCNRNYWFIKSIFVMFSLLIITISNYWLLPMILCVYVNLFGPLGWSILRYRVFGFSELWWKKRWLDWWIGLCLQKLIVQVLGMWRIHDSLGEDIMFVC